MVKVKVFADKYKPEYKTYGAAGMDLYAMNFYALNKKAETEDEYCEKVWIEPGGFVEISTGVKIELPFGYSGSLRLRSSLGREGLIIPNAPGTIDSDYRGEIQILVYNISDNLITLMRGDRIAQLVVQYTPQVDLEFITFTEFKKRSESSIRGEGRFGSTGK